MLSYIQELLNAQLYTGAVALEQRILMYNIHIHAQLNSQS